ncbi:MAG: hypothetical protein ACREHG_03315 [Candidatus Saccharimonadales bacterium]
MNFVNILANDLGLDTTKKRNAWISLRLDKDFEDIGELTTREASSIIDQMIKYREDKREVEKAEADLSSGDANYND